MIPCPISSLDLNPTTYISCLSDATSPARHPLSRFKGACIYMQSPGLCLKPHLVPSVWLVRFVAGQI